MIVSETEPDVTVGDNNFIAFVAACEKRVFIETRDAVAVLVEELYSSPSPTFLNQLPETRYACQITFFF